MRSSSKKDVVFERLYSERKDRKKDSFRKSYSLNNIDSQMSECTFQPKIIKMKGVSNIKKGSKKSRQSKIDPKYNSYQQRELRQCTFKP